VVEVTATVEATTDVPQRNPLWPAWEPSPSVIGAWVELQLAVRENGSRLACERDPEVWWTTRATPAGAAQQAAAVEACSWCPVRVLCAEYAIAAGERDGVWGGTTPADRRTAR
jgi:WhiB family redox-sensing transcriptional regulator